MDIESVLSPLKEELISESVRRDHVSVHVRGIQDSLRRTSSLQLQLHRLCASELVESGSKASLAELCRKAMAVLEENEANWKALVEVAGGRDAVEKYRHCWRNVAQQTSSLVAFIYWLENRILVSKEQVEEFAKMSPVGLDVEDYLIGLCSLPQELSRLSVNCVAQGNYRLPLQIHAFIAELFASFQQLNLRNDTLRKRYDSIKYDLQRVEQVIYDLKIRNLIEPTDS